MWKTDRRAAFVTVVVVGMSAVRCTTQSDGGDLVPAAVNKFYETLRSEAQADYESAQRGAEIEKVRKAKAGQPPVSAEVQKDGDEGIKFLLYNKAVQKVVCYWQTAKGQSTEEWQEKYKECFNAKFMQLIKFMKISEQYSSFDGRKVTACEIKARDYENEIRFPPYDFLRTPSAPKLFDFGALNDCVISGL